MMKKYIFILNLILGFLILSCNPQGNKLLDAEKNYLLQGNNTILSVRFDDFPSDVLVEASKKDNCNYIIYYMIVPFEEGDLNINADLIMGEIKLNQWNNGDPSLTALRSLVSGSDPTDRMNIINSTTLNFKNKYHPTIIMDGKEEKLFRSFTQGDNSQYKEFNQWSISDPDIEEAKSILYLNPIQLNSKISILFFQVIHGVNFIFNKKGINSGFDYLEHQFYIRPINSKPLDFFSYTVTD